MNTLSSIVVIVLCLVLQGIVLHIAYRRKFAAEQTIQQAARLHFQQAMNGKLEQTKRQIRQLQSDLKTARQQLQQHGTNDAASVRGDSEARQALERELDNATSLRSSLPLHGFADTQPAPQDPQNGTLLFR